LVKSNRLALVPQRDESGRPYVLPSVKKAEEILYGAKGDKEYLPITGLGNFTHLAARLAYGDNCKPLKEGRVS
jgi:aspartate aminotransferase